MKTLPNMNVYDLAKLAELSHEGVPASTGSPGGRWLADIAGAVNEALEYGLNEDSAVEIADSSIPAYTNRIMNIYVELRAYHDSPDISDVRQVNGVTFATYALYDIAYRLVTKLIAMVD
jgi:hypothetical protein